MNKEKFKELYKPEAAWTTRLHVGFKEETITKQDVHVAQVALLQHEYTTEEKELIDAILSHFVDGRETKWEDKDGVNLEPVQRTPEEQFELLRKELLTDIDGGQKAAWEAKKQARMFEEFRGGVTSNPIALLFVKEYRLLKANEAGWCRELDEKDKQIRELEAKVKESSRVKCCSCFKDMERGPVLCSTCFPTEHQHDLDEKDKKIQELEGQAERLRRGLKEHSSDIIDKMNMIEEIAHLNDALKEERKERVEKDNKIKELEWKMAKMTLNTEYKDMMVTTLIRQQEERDKTISEHKKEIKRLEMIDKNWIKLSEDSIKVMADNKTTIAAQKDHIRRLEEGAEKEWTIKSRVYGEFGKKKEKVTEQLVICNMASSCTVVKCAHKEKHKRLESCDLGVRVHECGKCIPYVEKDNPWTAVTGGAFRLDGDDQAQEGFGKCNWTEIHEALRGNLSVGDDEFTSLRWVEPPEGEDHKGHFEIHCEKKIPASPEKAPKQECQTCEHWDDTLGKGNGGCDYDTCNNITLCCDTCEHWQPKEECQTCEHCGAPIGEVIYSYGHKQFDGLKLFCSEGCVSGWRVDNIPETLAEKVSNLPEMEEVKTCVVCGKDLPDIPPEDVPGDGDPYCSLKCLFQGKPKI